MTGNVGGGGASFVDLSSSAESYSDPKVLNQSAASVTSVQTSFVNDTSVELVWTFRWDDSLWGPAYQFDLEMALGPYSFEFSFVRSVSSSANTAYNRSTVASASCLLSMSSSPPPQS